MLSEDVLKNVLMYQVSITITVDRLTAVSANLKVSSKRKLRLAESANGKLLCSVSVPHFYGKEATKNLNRSVDVGLPSIFPQSQHVFGTSSESNHASNFADVNTNMSGRKSSRALSRIISW